MNQLLMLKTQRVIYLSLLEDGNILDAITFFEKYQKQLRTYSDADEETQELVLKELNSSRNVFIKKLNSLANKYMKEKDYNKAAVCLSEVIYYWYKNISCIMQYIICLYNNEQYDLEEEYLNYLQTLIADNPDLRILKDLAKMYAAINKLERGISCLSQYINTIEEGKIESRDYELLAVYYHDLFVNNGYDIQNLLESMNCYFSAEDLNPTSPNIKKAIAMELFLYNKLEQSKVYWYDYFQLATPTYNDFFDYSMFCLKFKDFESFYKYYDFRFPKIEKKLPIPIATIKDKLWKGEDISEKSLLVFYEQGFGDTILTYGYVSRLAKLGKKVTFLVQDPLYLLLKDNEFGVEVLKHTSVDINQLDFDYYLPSMSIMSVLKLDENNISLGDGYIKADKNLVEAFKAKYFNNNKFKIGISYKGHPDGIDMRNIPIEEFAPLCDLENTELCLLMVDITEREYEFCQKHNIKILKKDLNNFAQTAAAIENLDVVVTSDNIILNLAGALGKKTFGIFNWHNDYRWYDLTGEDVGWYTSVKPFVNTSMNDWHSSMTRVVEEIKQLQE